MRKRDSFPGLFTFDLTTLLGGTLSTFFYSASGALLSYFGMLLVSSWGQNGSALSGLVPLVVSYTTLVSC